jgi:beta-galactosidase
MQIAKLATRTAGRYIKFVAKSEVNNKAWTSASEIGIQATADITAINEVTEDNLSRGGNDTFYTLQGVATATPTQGIYVHKGKKVLF